MTDSAEGIEYGPCSCMDENGETVRVGPEDFCTECFTPRGCCGPGRPVERSVTIEVTIEDLLFRAGTELIHQGHHALGEAVLEVAESLQVSDVRGSNERS